MPRSPNLPHSQVKDMYWFAHGGIEEAPPVQTRGNRSTTPAPGDTTEDDVSDHGSHASKNSIPERRTPSEEPIDCIDLGVQNTHSAAPVYSPFSNQKLREPGTWDFQRQDSAESQAKKDLEHQAAVLEARRNAKRSTMSSAFGAGDTFTRGKRDIAPVIPNSDRDRFRQNPSRPAAFDMTQSMTSSMFSGRGRRKNDLIPTVPAAGNKAGQQRSSPPKRSLSMSRLDQLAQPRKVYLDAQKAKSNIGAASGGAKEGPPTKPSTAPATGAQRRPQTAATRKPRPISTHGVPDHCRTQTSSRQRQTPAPRQPGSQSSTASSTASARAKSTDRVQKNTARPAPVAAAPQRPAHPSKSTKMPPPKPQAKQASPKTAQSQTLVTNKKKAAILATKPEPKAKEMKEKEKVEKAKVVTSPVRSSPPPPPPQTADDESASSADEKSSGKRIISEEEARAALAEKRKLAREQAEKEAEMEKLKQEELLRQEEERLRQEEEEQKRMETEQLRLLEEHRLFEEEKLRKAIEEQERKEEEEKSKREEEARLKSEQEKRAKEEAEKQRIELEEKLRKEEEERAERKKRLEKIMSRTRGKSGTASPSGSLSGSDPTDSIENPAEVLSSDPDSLDSNRGNAASPVLQLKHPSTDSLEVQKTLDLVSQSLNSNDLMMPSSHDNSLNVVASEPNSLDSNPTAFAEDKLIHEKGALLDTSMDSFSSGSDTRQESMLYVTAVEFEESQANIDLAMQAEVVQTEVKLPDPFTDSEALFAMQAGEHIALAVDDSGDGVGHVPSESSRESFQNEVPSTHAKDEVPDFAVESGHLEYPSGSSENVDSHIVEQHCAQPQHTDLLENLQAKNISVEEQQQLFEGVKGFKEKPASESLVELVSNVTEPHAVLDPSTPTDDHLASSNADDHFASTNEIQSSHFELSNVSGEAQPVPDLHSSVEQADFGHELMTEQKLPKSHAMPVPDESKILGIPNNDCTFEVRNFEDHSALEGDISQMSPFGAVEQAPSNPFAADFLDPYSVPQNYPLDPAFTGHSLVAELVDDPADMQVVPEIASSTTSSNPFGANSTISSAVYNSELLAHGVQEANVAASQTLQDGFAVVAQMSTFGDAVQLENVQVEFEKGNTNSSPFDQEFNSNVLGDSDIAKSKIQRTQNPFGDFTDRLPPVAEEYPFGREQTSNFVESEDSSLDSNLSQEAYDLKMVQESSQALGNGVSAHSNVEHELFDHQQTVLPSVPKSNGYNVNNGSLFDDRFESVYKADQNSASSMSDQYPVADISAVRSTLDNADNVNFNKGASNPFFGTGDSSSSKLPTNPF